MTRAHWDEGDVKMLSMLSQKIRVSVVENLMTSHLHSLSSFEIRDFATLLCGCCFSHLLEILNKCNRINKSSFIRRSFSPGVFCENLISLHLKINSHEVFS